MIDLKSMAVNMPEVVGHPNRAAFHGVLTMVDVPSQKAPSGAKGHLVVLTRKAAEAALPSLLGMALDYSPTWDRHDVRRKVGVITRAEIVGRNVELGGYLYARDFPEIVGEIAKSGQPGWHHRFESSYEKKDIHSFQAEGREFEGRERGYRLRASLRTAIEGIRNLRAGTKREEQKSALCRPTIRAEANLLTPGAGGLGLSYEVTDVILADAQSEVWRLEKVTFTGAAILRRDKAAYRDTWIELSK